jgi:hypothetical protein
MGQLRRFVATTLIVSMTAAGLPLPAQAGMLPTESGLAAASGARERAMAAATSR